MKRRWLVSAAVFCGLLLAATATFWGSASSSSSLAEAIDWEAHNRQVLITAQQVLQSLTDAETGQRGYVITGRSEYLEPYALGARQTSDSLDVLQKLTRDNPEQQTRIMELRQVVSAKLGLLAETIALVQAGNQGGAISDMVLGQGKTLMDRARAILGSVEAEERQRLIGRRAAADAAIQHNLRYQYGVTTLGLLMLGIAAIAAVAAADATARERVAAARLASGNKVRLLVERAPAAIAMFDADMRYVAVSQRYIDDYHLRDMDGPQHLAGLSHYDVFPDVPLKWREIHRRVLAGETLAAEDEAFPRLDGSVDYVRWEMAPWTSATGAIGGAVLFSEVVTSRKLAELRRKILFDLGQPQHSPQETMATASRLVGVHLGVSRVGYEYMDGTGNWIHDEHEYIESAVAASKDTDPMSGLDLARNEDLQAGRTLMVADLDRDHAMRTAVPDDRGTGTGSLLAVPLNRNGQLCAIFYLCHPKPRNWTAGEVRMAEEVAAHTWNLVEQARMQAAIQRTAGQFRMLANGLPVLCWMAHADGHIYWYNQRWYDYTGKTPEEMAGWGWRSVHDPEMLPAVEERWQVSLATGNAFEMTFPLRAADGTFRPFMTRIVSVRGADEQILCWLGTNIDMTEAIAREQALCLAVEREMLANEALARARDQLESRVAQEIEERQKVQANLAQAEKLAALGQLAGGIAHDFNNVMQVVSGGARLIGRRSDDPAIKRLVQTVAEASRRGETITRRLLAFARRDELRAEAVNVSNLIAGLGLVLKHTLGAGIEITVDIADTLPSVLADQGQLETVLINLATNARDAMPDGGTITFSAMSENVADRGHPEGLVPGAYVRLAVMDTGAGIPAETLKRIMEPFFTTKPQGKGTGLGLPMARGFAEQSGGALTISSEPGHGTSVMLWLPATSQPVISHADLDDPRPDAPSEAPRILLVDDEDLVRGMLAEELRDQGFEVLQAEAGAPALALLDSGEHIDLIISDLSMPRMDGVTVIREAQQRRPRLPAILLTGYAGNAASIAVGGALKGSFSLLLKPVTGTRLGERVATLLEVSAAG